MSDSTVVGKMQKLSGVNDGASEEHQEQNEPLDTEELPVEIQEAIERGQTPDKLTLDEIFEILMNERRREVIAYLRSDADHSATLDELAEYIAAKENDIEIPQLSSAQRKRVYIGLYQCHLPKMDEYGVIDFEKNRGTIELTDTITQLEPYIELHGQQDNAQLPHFELGVTTAVLVVVGIAFLGIGPLAAVPGIYWSGITMAALIAVVMYRFVGQEGR